MAAYEIEPCALVFQCVRIKNKVCNAPARSSALRKGMVAKKSCEVSCTSQDFYSDVYVCAVIYRSRGDLI